MAVGDRLYGRWRSFAWPFEFDRLYGRLRLFAWRWIAIVWPLEIVCMAVWVSSFVWPLEIGENLKVIEQIQLKFRKRILKVRTTTPHFIIY